MSAGIGWSELQRRWAVLASRERRLLSLAGALVLAAALWQWGMAPALRTLHTAPAQTRVLNAQLQHMQALQAQAQALQKQSPLGYDDALRALTAAMRETLGPTAQISVVAERATVTLQAASPDALALWLEQARLNARAVPLEAHLARSAVPGGSRWSGVLVMGLPTRP